MTRSEHLPDARVSGGNILSMLAAMGPFRRRGEQILAEHGITDVEADAWYPLSALVDALETISEKMGPSALFQTGQNIPDHVFLPPDLDSFEKVAGSFAVAFDMNHRGVEGGISHQMTDERTALIVSGTPYPCDFDRGVIQGFFHRLISTRIHVVHDTAVPCKNDGGTSCTHLVTMV